MEKLQFKKLHKDAKLPVRATDGSAGYDITAVGVSIDVYENLVYSTGLAVKIPKGYVGLLFMRSSVSKKDINLVNAVGVLDCDYRGEIMFKYDVKGKIWALAIEHEDFPDDLKKGTVLYYETAEQEYRKIAFEANAYPIGDRIGQLVVVPCLTLESEFVKELDNTSRGTGGFGSTGN